MKNIWVSDEVHAELNHRRQGKAGEDDVLRGLLNLPARKKTLWRQDIYEALKSLGGLATLDQIYQRVEGNRKKAGRSCPPNLRSVIRGRLQEYCSTCARYKGEHNIFYRSITKRGVWGLHKPLPGKQGMLIGESYSNQPLLARK